MILVFIGPPGSGKGTQSSIISSLFSKIKLISVGDLLRARLINSEDSISEKLRFCMDKGILVPDEIVVEIVSNSIVFTDPAEILLLDGFPRNLLQAESLNKKISSIGRGIDAVFYFDIPLDKLLKRSLGRFTCFDCGLFYNYYSKPSHSYCACDSCRSCNFLIRGDDDYRVIIDRLKTYINLTEPLCDFYKKSSLLIKVDATKSSQKVNDFIVTRIKKIGGDFG